MEEKQLTVQELQEIQKSQEAARLSTSNPGEPLPQQRTQVIQTVQQIRVAPTPHPDEIRALKKINPRYADIVMDMAPREQKFRHFSTLFGQFNFVLIAALGYGLGGWLGYMKLEAASIAAIVVTSYLVYALKTNKPKPPKIDAKNGTVATDPKE